MEITNEVKQRIVAAIAADRENYPSDNRHATALGIAPSVYNAIKRGNYEKQVSDANWVGIARRLGVQLRTEIPWLAAQTPTYESFTDCVENNKSKRLYTPPMNLFTI